MKYKFPWTDFHELSSGTVCRSFKLNFSQISEKNTENTGRNPFTPLSKVWLSLNPPVLRDPIKYIFVLLSLQPSHLTRQYFIVPNFAIFMLRKRIRPCSQPQNTWRYPQTYESSSCHYPNSFKTICPSSNPCVTLLCCYYSPPKPSAR